mgnify:FL=1
MCDLKFSELDRSEAAQAGRLVFSVQLPPLPAEDESEVRTGRKLIDASKAAGVEIFAHTSVLDSRWAVPSCWLRQSGNQLTPHTVVGFGSSR